MENRSHALMTGFFTIVLLAAAVLFGVWFNRDRVEREPYLLATTMSVPGLNAQAAVRYRGLEVGKVDAIDFDPKVTGQILVHLSVDKGTPVTETTYASLGYQGVTGIAYVQLDDELVGSKRLATSADSPSRIPLRPGLFDQLEKRGKKILDQAEALTAKVNELVSPANQQVMLGAFRDVSKAADAFGAIPRQLAPTLAKLPELTAQAQRSLDAVAGAGADVSKMARNYEALGNRLQAPGGTLDQITGTVDRVGLSVEAITASIELDTLPHVIDLSDEARSSMRVLKRTMEGLNERPQSILFGAPEVPPGPGEAGFTAPQ
ncbi:phospholipid/cholesterol/gamma-HCH transport system substrate-binding protein [Janthinobacterium sp. CG_23.3]|uniref:MlaD family protein n=1 Tax=unclassified Janthinobacterium TaxID=2610881 RepID=UPI000346482E|nr:MULTISPECIES: MlaD family protein [unclassified Janthinobacterium]MEC5163479.1 phospholipid/cholesterol/gamma-HCH transport system substrate-binding protein [Janthinobacterium sp. CG_S6]